MFERLAAAIVRNAGGHPFPAPAPPPINSVWTPEWQPAPSRTVVMSSDEHVCYRRPDGQVRWVKLATWHRWRRDKRAYQTTSAGAPE